MSQFNNLEFENEEVKRLTGNTARPKISLDFELWEILTAFTLAFTLASVLIWFSTLQPKRLQNEFLSLEKNKNSLYNLATQVEEINTKKSQLLFDEKTQSCLKDLKPDTVLDKKNQAGLQVLENSYNNIKLVNSQNTLTIEPQPSLKTIDENFINYLSTSKSLLNQNTQFNQQLSDFSQTLNSLCLDNPELSGNYLFAVSDFESILSTSNNPSLEPAKTSLNILKKTLLENNPTNSKKLSKEQIQGIIKEARIVVSLNAEDFINFETSQTAKDKLFISLKNLENWQKSYITKNPPLKEKVVFIFDAEAKS